MKEQKEDYRVKVKFAEVTSVAWRQQNKHLAFATSMGDVQLHDIKNKKTIFNYKSKTYNGIKQLVFSPFYPNLLCSAGVDGSLGFYDLEKQTAPNFLKIHQTKCTGLVFSPISEAILVTSGLDEVLNFLDLREKKVIKNVKIRVPLTAISISKNGGNIFVGSYFGDLIGFDIRNTKPVLINYKGHDKKMINSIDTAKYKKSPRLR